MSMDQYQEFIAASRYARWLPEEGRRESWSETVTRYIQFWTEDQGAIPAGKEGEEVADELYDAIVNLEVMPSMRCLMTAGPALERDNVAGFNCSYLPMTTHGLLMNSCTSCYVELVLALVLNVST